MGERGLGPTSGTGEILPVPKVPRRRGRGGRLLLPPAVYAEPELPQHPPSIAYRHPVVEGSGRGPGRPPCRALVPRPASSEGSAGDPVLVRGHSPAPAVYERL